MHREHVPAANRHAEDPEGEPELRTEGDEDDALPERVEEADPDDAEVEERVRQLGAGDELVGLDADVGRPADPEGDDQHEGHQVAGIGEVLRQGGGVLLVVYGHAAPEALHHGEDVAVGVDDRDEAGAEEEDAEGGRVGGHVAPVQHADVGLLVEEGLVEAEQRRAAHHRGGDPREGHPALAPRLRLDGLVAQRLASGQIAVHADPHERIHGHRPKGHFQVTDNPAQDVTVHPVLHQGGIHRQRHHEQSAQKIRDGQRKQVTVDHLLGTCKTPQQTKSPHRPTTQPKKRTTQSHTD